MNWSDNMNLAASAAPMWSFPPPLWGRDREGGIAGTEFVATPHPNPPPQGGREQAVPRGWSEFDWAHIECYP